MLRRMKARRPIAPKAAKGSATRSAFAPKPAARPRAISARNSAENGENPPAAERYAASEKAWSFGRSFAYTARLARPVAVQAPSARPARGRIRVRGARAKAAAAKAT